MSEEASQKALVLGGQSGLLGMSLAEAFAHDGWEVSVTPRPEHWAYDVESLREFFQKESPDLVLNTWAYTQVDLAEDEPEEARRVNKILPGIIGKALKGLDIPLVHYSTDFVFDGKKGTPYLEDDKADAESVYGKTKRDGEKALLDLGLDKLFIIRTAWLFGPKKKNFVKTMLTLCKDRENIGVVHDQVGSPTYTPDLAQYSLALIKTGQYGLYHLANSGRASWCELASEAVRAAGYSCTVNPIPSEDYPQKAQRPAFSVLDTSRFTQATGITPRPWLQAVQEYVYSETAETLSQ